MKLHFLRDAEYCTFCVSSYTEDVEIRVAMKAERRSTSLPADARRYRDFISDVAASVSLMEMLFNTQKKWSTGVSRHYNVSVSPLSGSSLL